MVSFVVKGPFKVPVKIQRGGRELVFDEFWAENSDAHDIADKRGCYIFAIKNKTINPIYIGKTNNSFRDEATTNDKLHKYQKGFVRYRNGSPVMYFVVHPSNRGPINIKAIKELENFLIQSGIAKNPDLQNVRGTRKPSWSIQGVIRSGAGVPSNAASEFKKLFDIRS
jgi:hypothetical protein